MFYLFTILFTSLYKVLTVYLNCSMYTVKRPLTQHKCSCTVFLTIRYLVHTVYHKCLMHTFCTIFVTLFFKNALHKILYVLLDVIKLEHSRQLRRARLKYNLSFWKFNQKSRRWKCFWESTVHLLESNYFRKGMNMNKHFTT